MKRISTYTYEEATDLLGRLPRNPSVIIDIGAGKRDSPISSQVRMIECDKLISIEGFDPYASMLLHIPVKAKSHDVVKANLIKSYYRIPVCDAALLIDVIEHLQKKDGIDLIENFLKKNASQIVIFTVVGDTIGYSNHDMNNPLQEHLSAWTAEEFESMGFDVVVYEKFHTHVKVEPVDAMWCTWRGNG